MSSFPEEQTRDILRDEATQRSRRIDNVALVNAAVVGGLTFAALYELLHVDVKALIALWEYGLGPTTHADITYFAVAFDLLARLPMDALHRYEALVPTNPIFYKACTSGVAYGIGDFISQIYQGKTISTIDLPRSFRSAAAGFIGHGPLCHYWLLTMETYLDFNGAWWATGIKVTADLTVWAIFLNAAYSFIIGTLAMRSPTDVWKDVKATSWPALRSAWRFWPFVHTISFSHAVPMDLKLLWVDIMEIIWVTILSKVANEDKNAKIQEQLDTQLAINTEQEQQQAAVVQQQQLAFEVAAAVEGQQQVTVVQQLEYQQEHGVNPALEIELTREEEQGKDNLSFELPKKVLNACWPLIAMWPVLYAGYYIETEVLGLTI